MANQHLMGGSNVATNTSEINFSDGTVQTTAAVAPAPPSVPVLLQATVTLTRAQLLALSTTPIIVIPAPGAGFYIWPQYYTMEYTFGGIAYTGTGNCSLIYGPPPIVNPTNLITLYNWTAATSGIIHAAFSCVFIGLCGEGLTPITTVNNAAVVFSAANALTLGNGTLNITVNYSVLPI